jgi:anhydro-N-acetylmuramic acid kinase
MIEKLNALSNKKEKYVIGLMSGTSTDGIDAALVKITGSYTSMKLEEIAFQNYPYTKGVKERIFQLFDGGSVKDICHMNFVIGDLFADAAIDITQKAGIREVDLIGSHGQTIYHIPDSIDGYRSTLQIGEGAVIAHKTGVITVSDFRLADMAAGGLGAPLVPYTEFLLYSGTLRNIALQNIGGIGNITFIPGRNAVRDNIIAFDTGPGNMVIDYITKKTTGREFDECGMIANKGTINNKLLSYLMQDEFIMKPPPKATGREYFGKEYSERFYHICKQEQMSDEDIISSATAFTAESIRYATRFIPCRVDQMIISGGGAYNLFLVNEIKKRLPETEVITQESTGRNSDAKEAVAFAVLANETICGNAGNLPKVTGAQYEKILGKINL